MTLNSTHNGSGNSDREGDTRFWTGVLGLMRNLGYHRSLVKLRNGNLWLENFEENVGNNNDFDNSNNNSNSNNNTNNDHDSTYLVEIKGGVAKFYRGTKGFILQQG